MKNIFIGGCPRSGTNALAHLLTKDGRAIVTLEKGIDAWKKVFEEKSEEAKKKLIYVGDKMPEGYLSNAERLYKQFPEAKFIFTNRNGYGVISSYLRGHLKINGHEGMTKQILLNEIKVAEKLWVENYNKLKNLKNILPEDKYLLLLYENNCADINNMLVKLGEFLEYDSAVNNLIYKPTHLNWVGGIEFWEEIILDSVSNDFKYMNNEYNKLIIS